ncbi:hypothetical protein FJU54_13560 [Acinetobacter baumannii]|uniref:hypothetical protein n=1 Tax=Acinetobacter baumannii TaxID=470 RepID=UPI000A33DAD4|nr:hypothetical protein [Acinetobacter baumannii]OTS29469.1 hypothetical protein CAT07_11015 [Acinetobacter baumannii]TPT98441.1 hypothetical protein FJU54_13560 [Acinetobacter baumannii]
MQVHDKRKLLEAIDVLIRRPAAGTDFTLAEAMAYFKMLIEESTQGQIEVRYSDTTQQLPF